MAAGASCFGAGLAGVAAALHVGKLPPALPVLRDALGVSLVEAGFLLSLVQLAGMTLGLFVGLAADALGLRRSMIVGLVLMAVCSGIGMVARHVIKGSLYPRLRIKAPERLARPAQVQVGQVDEFHFRLPRACAALRPFAGLAVLVVFTGFRRLSRKSPAASTIG